MKNYYLNLVNPLTSDNLGIGHKINKNMTVLQGEHFIKEAIENFKLAGIDPKKSIVYITETFFNKAQTVGYSLESYLLKFNAARKLSGYTTDSATVKYINKGIKQICELLDNPETGKLILIDDSTSTDSDNTNNEKENTISIQNILSNDTIDQSDMIKLAINSERRVTVLDELEYTRLNLHNLKTLLEDRLKESYDYKEIIKDYKRIRTSTLSCPDYSLKTYINDTFGIDLCYMESPIPTEDTFLTDLYYDEDDDYNMFDFMSDEIGYENPEDCISISAMLTYFRDYFETTIEHINEVIDYTMKIEMLLTRLHNELIDKPNTLTLLKMAYA